MLANITKLFGSDVYTAYTAKYTWQCNQVAHMGLGFVGATVVVVAASRLGGSAWLGLGFLVVPFLKDLTDYVVDKARTSKLSGESPETQRFELPESELGGDAITDFFFWTAGCLLAVLIGLLASPAPGDSSILPFALRESVPALSEDSSPWTTEAKVLAVGTVVLFLGLFFVPWRLYIRAKRKFDDSQLPVYFRLPNFRRGFEENEDFDAVEAFANGKPNAKHLLISGEFKSGRTTLAAGIGCRLTVPVGFRFTESEIESRSLRYLTASKLFEEVEAYQKEFEDRNKPANTQTSRKPKSWLPNAEQFLIVDDVILAELSKDSELRYQKQSHSDIGTPVPMRTGYETAFKALDDKQVIWVVADPMQLDKWKEWVELNFPPKNGEETLKLARLNPQPSKGSTQQPEFGPSTLPGLLAVIALLVALVVVIGALLVIAQADRLGAFGFCALFVVLVGGIFAFVAKNRRDVAETVASNP